MKTIEDLLSIMNYLRNSENGCPWDLQQNYKSLAPYALEEAYEVVDAIENGSLTDLRDELGDLLFQIVFHAQIAREEGQFTFADVVNSIAQKLINRHPHVFGDEKINSAEEQAKAWEEHKRREQSAKPEGENSSILDGITGTLPATTRAVKLQKKAASVGFDWKSITPIFDKVIEELDEVRVEVEAENVDGIEDEIGDLFFAVTNLARHTNLDPETALRRANRKFESRFRKLEIRVRNEGLTLQGQSQEYLESLWNEVKQDERKR